LVSLDGGTPLKATVSVPSRAVLAFTAGTGGLTDVHAISQVSITQQPPTGPITGIASKCVEVRGSATADGTPVQLSTCTGSAGQSWSARADQTLRALGKCLDVTAGGTANGTPVQLYTCNSTGAQTWIAQANGTLRNPQSNRCLDDPAFRTTDGTVLTIYDCNAGTNQIWKLPA
jgi:hypothetical protein